MRPLDSLHSIKLKLGVVIVAAVIVTVGVVRLGEAADRREVAFRLSGSVLVLVGAAALAIAR